MFKAIFDGYDDRSRKYDLFSDENVLQRKVIVTVNCEVRIRDLTNNVEEKYLFVPTEREKIKKYKYSILSPIGLAIVGNKVGDVVEWPVAQGERKLEMLDVVHHN